MSKKKQHLLLWTILLAASGAYCRQDSVVASPTPSSPPDACSLLTAEEVQAVQSDSLKETKPSRYTSGGMLVSQCFFATRTSANSVTLLLASPAVSPGDSPRDVWRKRFEAEEMGGDRSPTGKSSEKNRDRESKPLAQRVEGLGEQAYWTPNAVGGALYVLQGNRFIRVSVGGVADQRLRLARCKTLALAVLRHLAASD
jgi:hypothetical protein